MDESTCSIDGCEMRVKWSGWCQTHYRRHLKYGDPLWRPSCEECGEKFNRTHPRQKFCTDECYARKELRESRVRALVWSAANRGKRKEYGHRRRARTRGLQVVPITADMLAARAAVFGDRCWMCGGPHEEWDHVKPLSKGGPHMLSNLRPACGRCNRTKHAKWEGPRAA